MNFDNQTNNGTLPSVDEASIMPVLILIIVLTVISMFVTHRLLHFFARADTPFSMSFFVGLTWFLGIFGILVLLPVDFVGAFYGVGDDLISVCWKVVYWLTFMLAWILCPVAMEYHASGYFTFRARLWDAIKSNVKIYLIIGVVLLILGAGLAATRGLSPAFVLAAANFYGMFLIVIMLGYGLVEVPMSQWRAADPVKALESQEFRAAGAETNLIDAEDNVDMVISEIAAFRRRLERGGDDDLIKLTDQVLEKVPRREANSLNRQNSSALGTSRSSSSAPPPAEPTRKVDVHALAALNYRLKRCLVAAERARWDWDDLLEKTAFLEKLLHDRRRIDPSHAAVVLGNVTAEEPPTAEEEEDEAAIVMDTPWKKCRRSCRSCSEGFRVRGYTPLYRVGAFFYGCLSLILLWCAVVSPFSIQLSLFGKMAHEADQMVTVFLATFVPLMYMAMCVYTALFKFKGLDVLALHGNRQTDAYNLLYNASYMGRLQFSLGVFYFQMLYPQDSQDTAFRKLVGDMDTVPFLGSNFNRFSPFCIIFFSIASFFNCGDRLLDFLGISTHRRPRRGNAEHEERIEEGRRLIASARERRERERMRQQRLAMNASNGVNGIGLQGGAGYARVEDLLDRL